MAAPWPPTLATQVANSHAVHSDTASDTTTTDATVEGGSQRAPLWEGERAVNLGKDEKLVVEAYEAITKAYLDYCNRGGDSGELDAYLAALQTQIRRADAAGMQAVVAMATNRFAQHVNHGKK